MAFSDYSLVPSDNTTVAGQNIAPGGPPSAVGPILRQYAADGKDLADKVAAATATQAISVLTFGADPTGATDSTAAINAAVQAAATHIGNATLLKRDVLVPKGTYKIGGTIYVRKGQHLRGAGMGATYLDCSTAPNTGPVIRMGRKSDGTVDAGGLFPELSGFITLGGPADYPVVDTTGIAGWSISDVMFSFAGIGILMGGGDGKVLGCYFDDGLNHIISSGRNNLVSACQFYLGGYQVTFQTDSADTLFSGCQFHYARNASVFTQTGATGNKNIGFHGCEFLLNEQFASHLAFVAIKGVGGDLHFSGCSFRNGYTYAIKWIAGGGSGNSIVMDGCLINGSRTFSGYAQSTSAGGVDATNMNATIRSTTFYNLGDYAVNFGGSEAVKLKLIGCEFEANAQSTECLITQTNGSSKVMAQANMPDGAKPLFNAQGAVPVYAKAAAEGQVTLVAGTVTIALPLVRASSKITVQRHTDGGTVGASYSIGRTAGTGFTITAKDGAGATQAADTSVLNYAVELAGS